MPSRPNVADFIADMVQRCGRLQKQIARDAGFDSPNMITMIKQGNTKLPLDKVGPLAIAIGIDPVQLLKMCLAEYFPATWAATKDYFDSALTLEESSMIKAMRDHAGLPYVAALGPDIRKHLDTFLSHLKEQAAPID